MLVELMGQLEIGQGFVRRMGALSLSGSRLVSPLHVLSVFQMLTLSPDYVFHSLGT